ncbi:family 43 glycosylhydrolase [Nocardia sp. NPDC050697]|uniref:family 43 glycosylhydrolase n=1 Tax=Nocardia sp. NPDC050697 TaxID=3155158 RepID=UPI0033E07513
MTDTRIICNPLDLGYRYQDLRFLGISRSVGREAADPSVVAYQNRFFMFASMSAGFWHSADLVQWSFCASSTLPAYEYAPDARVVDGAIVVCASRRTGRSAFYRSTDPLGAGFAKAAPGTFPFWDPNLFQDHDDRLYLYWGCSNRTPIHGVELDRDSFAPVGSRQAVVAAAADERGWERTGEDHDPTRKTSTVLSRILGDAPFIEGAWMTEHAGTYYLQYSAPATESNTYGDGYFVSDHPLGPFTYALDSPYSHKPGGFITGAGHGSLFRDRYGNWWHAATMRVSVNFTFERRLGIFPAGFDEDGVLFCNQRFGDYPMTVPAQRADPWTDTFPGWMLLSYRKPVTASSSAAGHGPDSALNEDIRTWWAAAGCAAGEWIEVDLGGVADVHAVQVNLADHEVAAYKSPPRLSELAVAAGAVRAIETRRLVTEYIVEASATGEDWTVVLDTRDAGADRPHGFTALDRPGRYRYIRFTSSATPYGAPVAVSGLRVFGRGRGDIPAVALAEAKRTGPLNARITWSKSDTADGYLVKYGRHPDKLYHSWTVHDRCDLDLSTLNAGADYWVAVDAFNACGIAEGETIAVR